MEKQRNTGVDGMKRLTFEVSLDMQDILNDCGRVSPAPSKSDMKDLIESLLSWQHPHDERKYISNLKVVAKR